MNEIDAIILGVIQGLTEFLPVSSSGHLEITRELLDTNQLPSDNLLMTSVLHFATALSTILVFRKDIYDLIKGLFDKENKSSKSYIIKILIALVPAGLVGFLLSDEIEFLFSGNMILVGIMLIITGTLLFLTKILKTKNFKISSVHALIIGLSQAFAVIPGISRSGATICTSLFLGNNKSEAAKFSFLIVIPVIFGAILKDVLSGDIFDNEIKISILIIGFISSFLTGVLACKLMLKIVANNNLIYFSFYCFVLGIISIFII
ncbi:MAG: UDP-diphosphatase [Flavobacteriaceae bacterium]|nr:UDP-diphosphatase [Flavobacteriaceae bacterium]|tara:strand:+ start:1970 stop:2755 length:786 start_codon:yes stop_codon:yes gene_type:complete